MNTGWNHNIHYHDLLLRAVPSPCDRALDVGCGQGLLATQLASRCATVVGIDLDLPRNDVPAKPPSQANLTFVQGDVMTHPFPPASFDFISAVATLHHLPLEPALTRLRDLLRPGGVLAIVGLYRATTLTDYAIAAVALPLSRLMHLLHGDAEVQARIHPPSETLHDLRTATLLLPGATFRRHLFFRYTLLWRKP